MPEAVDRFSERVVGYTRRAISAASRWMNVPGLMLKSVYEVRPTSDGWMIAERGSSSLLRVFPKKQDAIREASKMGRNHKAESTSSRERARSIVQYLSAAASSP